jgi:hypothetical protein
MVPSAMNVRNITPTIMQDYNTHAEYAKRGERDRMVNISDTMLDMVVDKIPIFHLTILNTFLLLTSCGTQVTHGLPHCLPTERN